MAHKQGQGSSRNGRDSNSQRRGVKVFGGQSIHAGSIIIRDTTTLIADLYELVDEVHPDWVSTAAKGRGTGPSTPGACVLLVEDSEFFRNQLKKFLEDEGYTVLAAPDGEVGYELDGVPFELVWTSEKIAVQLDPTPGVEVDGWRILAPDAAAIAAAWKEQSSA